MTAACSNGWIAKILPGSERQARPFLLAQLHRLTKDRLSRYGNTIYHLEPNVKESPGGLRDYQATVWMQTIRGERKDARTTITTEDELVAKAVDFLSEIRCFLHYSNGRNDNTLTYELQAAAAARSLGIADGPAKDKPRSWRWRPSAPAGMKPRVGCACIFARRES